MWTRHFRENICWILRAVFHEDWRWSSKTSRQDGETGGGCAHMESSCLTKTYIRLYIICWPFIFPNLHCTNTNSEMKFTVANYQDRGIRNSTVHIILS